MEGHHRSKIQATVARYLLISSLTSNYLTRFSSVDFHVSGFFRKHGNQQNHPQKQVIDALRNPRFAGALGLDLWVSSYAAPRLGKAVLKNLLLGIIAAEFRIARDRMKQVPFPG